MKFQQENSTKFKHWCALCNLCFLSCSNDEIEEGEQASDSDFEIDAKKEVRKCVCAHSEKQLLWGEDRAALTLEWYLWFDVHTGSKTEREQHQLWQSHAQPLRSSEEGEHRSSVQTPPAQSPPQATQRHAPGAGGHHVSVGLSRCWSSNHSPAGHTAGFTQETGARVFSVDLMMSLVIRL